MEGLNCVYVHVLETMNIQAWHGLSSMAARQSSPSSRTKNPNFPNQWGSFTYKLLYAPTAILLFFDPLFSPLTSAKNPCFYQKLSPEVLFFSHRSGFWKFFTQRPLIARIWEKGTQMSLILMAFVTERPHIFCLACTCLRGMLLPQTQSEAGKCCILELELRIVE